MLPSKHNLQPTGQLRGNLSSAIPEPVFLENKSLRPVAYRPYGLDGLRLPVIMLHGLESHSGWFTQSASLLASLGHPVYAMDRSGSGASNAERGACRDFRDLLADIRTLAIEVMSLHKTKCFHLLGHCFGSIPATAFACQEPSMLASLILVTPAIYTRVEPSVFNKLKILWSTLTGIDLRIPVSLKAEWFTDQKEYIEFIKSDEMTLKDASTHLYWEVTRARKFIRENEQKLTMPLMIATAGRDRICNNDKNQRFFSRLPSAQKKAFSYPSALHILEYSSEKDAFFSDLAEWIKELKDKLKEEV